MKFFHVEANDQIAQPRFIDWFNEMNPQQLVARDISQISRFTVSLHAGAIFTDIISYPYFMISDGFASLVSMYDESIQFRHVVLNDKENRRFMAYNIPLLEEIDCLSQESELNRDGSVLLKTVLLREVVKGRSLFQIGGVKNRYVVSSLELVESALRREALGLKITEVPLV